MKRWAKHPMTEWDALPEEVKELARQGILAGVGAGRHSAQPAGYWAQRAGMDVTEAVRRLKVLQDKRIVVPSDGGSKFHFSVDGNAWAVELVEMWASEANPFGEPELLMIGQAATSAVEVVDAARRLCPNLAFHSNCKWYPQYCRPPAPFHELARVFLVLDAMALAARSGLGTSMRKWINKYCVEHGFGSLLLKDHDRTTERNSNRKIRLNQQDVVLENHFTLGSSGALNECISVYFVRFPANAPNITVGYCGPHLPKD